jgi:hypothetical protein
MICEPHYHSLLAWLSSKVHQLSYGGDGFCFDEYGGHNPGFRASFEYLLFSIRQDRTPSLVTINQTPGARDAIIGTPGTGVLFGGNYDQGLFSGGRLTLIYNFDPCGHLGIGGSFFMLGQRTTRFSAESDLMGNPILAIPFYRSSVDASGNPVLPPGETATFVSQPGEFAGNVAVTATTRLLGADINVRKQLWQGSGLLPGNWCWEGLAGFRYMRLDESLNLHVNSVCLSNNCASVQLPINSLTISDDSFKTLNNFFGGQIGLEGEWRHGRWVVTLQGKLAVGMSQESVNIQGGTAYLAAPSYSRTDRTGGIFALPSNIGIYNRNTFSVVPEVGVQLSYQLTDQWRVFVGYNALVWTNVVRPGQQMDRVINTTQLPRPDRVANLVGDPRPIFNFNPSTFWAHGMTAGLEWRF